MSNFARYGGASEGSGPSPIVFGQIPRLTALEFPNRCWGVYEDFSKAFADDSAGTVVTGWIADYVGGAGVFTPNNAVGGGVIFDPANVDGQGLQIMTQELFKPTAGQKICFGASVAAGDADDSDLFVGLTTIDVDILGSNANDMAGLIVADGSANINYIVRKDGSGDATDTGEDLANAAAVRLEAVVDGVSGVDFYVDGVRVVQSTSSNINTGEEMSFAVAYLVGASTATATCTVKWAYCYQFED